MIRTFLVLTVFVCSSYASEFSVLPSAPPPAPVRNIAEYEPMEGVFIRYPLGIPASLIKEIADDVIVYCIVSSGEQSKASSSFSNAGVDMDNVKFINASSDSYWTRDYCPWWIVDGNGDIGIVDFQYNRPRPNDNKIPSVVDDFLQVPYYKMGLTTAGGNYMCDGYNIASSTKLVLKESSMSENQVAQVKKKYLGIEKFHAVDDPNLGSSIDHIDCWGKFLSPGKIMIRQVPQNNNDYNELEKAAEYWKNQTSAYGVPYTVYRVMSSGSKEAYTNCTIVNKKVLIPFANSSNDQAAKKAYEQAMPGYEIFGFAGSWQPTDALHCRTKGVPDRGMLYIAHIPLHGTIEDQGDGVEIEATIIPYSKKSLIGDSCKVYYKLKSDNSFNSVKISKKSANIYTATIPSLYKNDSLEYYLHAADNSGRSENHPYIGAPDAHTVYYTFTGTDIQVAHHEMLHQFMCKNYPEPFSNQTKIMWNIAQVNQNACLIIYDNSGRMIRRWNISEKAGSVTWNGISSDGRAVATGVYFYSIRNGNRIITKQMRLLK